MIKLVHEIWTDKDYPDIVHTFFGETEEDVKQILNDHYLSDLEIHEAIENEIFKGKKARVSWYIEESTYNGEIVKAKSSHLKLIKGWKDQSDIPGHQHHNIKDCNVKTG